MVDLSKLCKRLPKGTQILVGHNGVHPTFGGSPVMAMAAGFSCNKSACEDFDADDTPRF
jgi:hypothetical protein